MIYTKVRLPTLGWHLMPSHIKFVSWSRLFPLGHISQNLQSKNLLRNTHRSFSALMLIVVFITSVLAHHVFIFDTDEISACWLIDLGRQTSTENFHFLIYLLFTYVSCMSYTRTLDNLTRAHMIAEQPSQIRLSFSISLPFWWTLKSLTRPHLISNRS